MGLARVGSALPACHPGRCRVVASLSNPPSATWLLHRSFAGGDRCRRRLHQVSDGVSPSHRDAGCSRPDISVVKAEGLTQCRRGHVGARDDVFGWAGGGGSQRRPCLLYTSDAADERSSVDLGGRRIIKKKKETDRYG